MIKQEKKLSPAKKSCIKFGVLSAVNASLGVAGLVCSDNPILSVVAGASLIVSGLWAFLGVKAFRAPKKEDRKAKKCACKDHKQCFHDAKVCKCVEKKGIKAQVKAEYPGLKNFFKRIAETQKRYKEAGIPKSAKPYRIWKGTSITIGVLCGLIAMGSGVFLANNIIDAETLASEDNTQSEQHLDTDKVASNSLGVATAGASCIGLAIAAASAAKAAKKREDEMIENYHLEH